MKKVIMLLVAVASATASFASTGTPLPTATTTLATPQAKGEAKAENTVEAIPGYNTCSVTVTSGGRTVTASGGCYCTKSVACDIAYATAKSYLDQ